MTLLQAKNFIPSSGIATLRAWNAVAAKWAALRSNPACTVATLAHGFFIRTFAQTIRTNGLALATPTSAAGNSARFRTFFTPIHYILSHLKNCCYLLPTPKPTSIFPLGLTSIFLPAQPERLPINKRHNNNKIILLMNITKTPFIHFCDIRAPEGTSSVSQTFPPITAPLPIVTRPSIVAPA